MQEFQDFVHFFGDKEKKISNEKCNDIFMLVNRTLEELRITINRAKANDPRMDDMSDFGGAFGRSNYDNSDLSPTMSP
jgi:hypothetical protein